MVEVLVEFEYLGEQDDELTIKIGDIINNVVISDGGWWEGELDGKKGMFPDNFVKVLKKDNKNGPKKDADVESASEDTLMKVGESKPVESKPVESKQEAKNGGGNVAELANKLKDGPHRPVSQIKREKKNVRAKVTFGYKKENDDELTLEVGDVIDIIKQEEEEGSWWEGSLNGKVGVFPSNFVEIIGDKEETGRLTPDDPEKKDSNDFKEIKGKKVTGVGLGDIFGAGPIKLRSTTGSSVKAPSQSFGSAKSANAAPEKKVVKPERPPSMAPAVPAESAVVQKRTKTEKKAVKAVVRFSYQAENDDELRLNEGEIITVLDQEIEDSGWWRGEVEGRVGVFPDNFVELIPEEETKPKKPLVPVVSANQKPKADKILEPTKIAPEHPKTAPEHPKATPEHPKVAPDHSKTSMDNNKNEKQVKKKENAELAANEKHGPAPGPARKPYHPPPPVSKKPLPPKPTEHKVMSTDKKAKELMKDEKRDSQDSDSFDVIEPQTDKLVHLTADRAKQPNKRPPSQIFLHTDEEKNGDVKESSWLKDDKKNVLKKTINTVPVIKEQKEADTKKSLQPRLPPSVPAAMPSTKKPDIDQSDVARDRNQRDSSSKDNSALEAIQREMKELRANFVTKDAFDQLKRDNDKLRADFDKLKSSSSKRFMDMTAEVDEEKKARMNMTVEIERIKKLITDSNV